ncbi:MAG TPA: YbhN family protein [Actinophytocola sp.]|uniref:lysylphosphatidylglycerol synthase transmembrane domain-containing protein n=1 Tax=Actinophytocola sp. TaxID=1872138 RepID=UPI002E093DA3|nr:YbhN family protein [Actinophytocola sp.]
MGKWLRWLGVGAGLVLAVVLLRDRLPSPAGVSASLRQADTGWLLLAAGAELISMGMFARQQRRLLTAFGVRMPRHRAIALAYSRSAIAISVPAGSAVSAAYAFRQFRTDGASRAVATTVMVLSGLLSMAALALLYVTGAAAAGAVRLAAVWREHPALVDGVVALTVAVVLMIMLLAWPRPRTFAEPRPHTVRHPELVRWLRPVADAVRSSRDVAGRHWVLAMGAATANWLTDLLCLFAAVRAFHLPVGPVELGAVYLTVQIVRQIPLTPGGIGVIEVSLLAGLVSAGAAEAPATAAILVYRLFSCWLILPMGLLGALVLRHSNRIRSGSSHPAEPAPSLLETPPGPRPVSRPYQSTAAHV